jgi:hypothetical protein
MDMRIHAHAFVHVSMLMHAHRILENPKRITIEIEGKFSILNENGDVLYAN